jgi:predicted RNA-binding Zn-ribbon protein involved in translation (DUF1610 family)
MSSPNYESRKTRWNPMGLDPMDRRLLYFTCPACGDCNLLEVAEGLWSSREIKAVRANGAILYGECYKIWESKRSFRCGNCGHEFENKDPYHVADGQFLARWLITQEPKTGNS